MMISGRSSAVRLRRSHMSVENSIKMLKANDLMKVSWLMHLSTRHGDSADLNEWWEATGCPRVHKLKTLPNRPNRICNRSYRDGYKYPCVVLPCGGGKSILASEMAKQATMKGSLFLVPNRVMQTDILKWWGGPVHCGYGSRRVAKTQEPVLIIGRGPSGVSNSSSLRYVPSEGIYNNPDSGGLR